MTSTFRLLIAAMPEIASACERINDPGLRDRAFDVLVSAARDGGDSYALAPESSYAGFNPPSEPLSAYSAGDTRIDNGARG